MFTALRVLSNAIIKMGNPVAYTLAQDANNVPFKNWLNPQPGVLQNTWGSMWQYDGTARTVISMALYGEAFWLTLDRDKLQYPTALEVLNPAFIEIKQNKADGSPEYWYGSGVHRVQLPNEDITHIPFMALPGAARGLNSIEYGGVSFALALAALEFGQRWFSQGASPSFLLSTEQKIGKEEVERIAEKFMIEHSGLQSAHLPLVVDSGLKVEKISSTPDEAQYMGTLEYSRMCIAAWFGLPSHLVGGTSDKGNVWGKRLDVNTSIPTPFGWTLLGDIKSGDEVFDATGKVVQVTTAHQIELATESYRVTFNDGTFVDADADHLWETTTKLGHTAVRTTREILDTLHYGTRGDRNHRVKVAGALQLPEADLPVDPYVLGYWLGDGASAGGRFTCGSEDLSNLLEQLKIANQDFSEPKQWDSCLGVWQVQVRGLALTELGVRNNKHIPAEYLRASYEQRLALLQGLMDSDGNAVTSRPRVEFTNKNETLARDVLELARTLGLRPTIGRYEHKPSGKSDKVTVQWIVGFDPKTLDVFRLARKSFAVGGSSKRSRAADRVIVSVEPIEPVLMRCLTVDSEDHLFLCGDGMIPTHNTVQEQGIQLVDYTLSGYIVRLQEAYSSLLPKGQYAYLDPSVIQQANYTDRAAYITALRTATVMTPNEIRSKELGLAPIEGGDNIEAPLASNAAPAGASNPTAAATKEDNIGDNASGN